VTTPRLLFGLKTPNFPGEGFSKKRGRRGEGREPGRACLWGHSEAIDLPPQAVWGAYPVGFVEWAISCLQCRPAHVLHVCSGTLARDVGGVRIDLREAAQPCIVGDGRRLPFQNASFDGVLIDPPYTAEYARDLYGTGYPRPSALLREAARVIRPNGRVGFVHFLVPSPARGLKIERIYGVSQGCGYRIRAFVVFIAAGATLELATDASDGAGCRA
jgi:SAM-dependent methyltransferase